MKRLLYVIMLGLITLLILPATPSGAQSSKVPITYEGDTPETIARRAQWIEGAKQEGRLAWWATRRPQELREISFEFNKIYPFVKVDYWRGRGEEIASKTEADFIGGRHTIDVVLGGENYNAPRWRKMGMLGKFTHIVPGIKNIDKRMYSKHGDWIMGGSTVIVPLYNTDLVSGAEAPKNWEDLLDPKWKGHIGITTDMKVWSSLAMAEGGWGLEKTEQFLRKLKKQALIWGQSHTGTSVLMIAGEFKVFAEGYLHHVVRSAEQGAPIGWVKADPIPIEGSAYILMKNAPHPNASNLFLEWLFSPQGIILYEKITGKGAAFPGSNTRLSKLLKGLNLITQTEENFEKRVVEGWDNRFAEILGVTGG